MTSKRQVQIIVDALRKQYGATRAIEIADRIATALGNYEYDCTKNQTECNWLDRAVTDFALEAEGLSHVR